MHYAICAVCTILQKTANKKSEEKKTKMNLRMKENMGKEKSKIRKLTCDHLCQSANKISKFKTKLHLVLKWMVLAFFMVLKWKGRYDIMQNLKLKIRKF